MPPFVDQKHLSKGDAEADIDEFNYEISLLAAAKKSRLSFEELNLLSLNDFFDYLDMFLGNESSEPEKATQNDIDNFYRYM